MGTGIPGSFGEVLREYRQCAGLTQEALAERARVSVRGIQELERGAHKPLRDTAQRLATALDLTGDDRVGFVAAATPAPRQRGPARADPAVEHAHPSPSGPAELPRPLTPFIGREREVALVREALWEGARLVTLTGAGGTGKTRLALRIAGDVRRDFADGILFVDLTATRDPDLVPALIARTYGLLEAAGRTPQRTPQEMLIAALRERRLLLVLDNCEHVLAALGVVATLLAEAPGVTVLATSRVALHLYGEHEVRVPPLDAPDPAVVQAAHPDALCGYAAVQLFLQRARAARADLALTPEVVRATAMLCARLDGLPLAIELAAARCKLYAPATLLARLGDRLALLAAGPHNLPERQQTLRNTLDWSYALLRTEEQRLFAREAVFDGGWDLEAAEVICAPGLGTDVRGGLEALVDHGLVEVSDDRMTGPRFRLLETVREYAAARLAESVEAEDVRQRHARYYLALAERADPALIGPEQVAWQQRLERELPNLRVALRTLLDSGDGSAALRLGAALDRFWSRRSHIAEGRVWLDEALALGTTAGPERAKALVVAGYLSMATGGFERAEALLVEALSLYRELGDERGVAWVLSTQGELARWRGDYTHESACREQALALYRRSGDRWGEAMTLYTQAGLTFFTGDMSQADPLLRESRALFVALGDRWGMAATLMWQAALAMNQGAYATAGQIGREALPLCREVDTWMTASVLKVLARVLAGVGQEERAVRLFAAAEMLYARTGKVVLEAEKRINEEVFAPIRAQLGDAAFAAAQDAGRALSVDDAIEEVLGFVPT